ncbi:aldehyde dehydrogenase, partial [Arthrobacter deserti]|nr:aldehyde dehydrogenase [Arthrobacter deserti]
MNPLTDLRTDGVDSAVTVHDPRDGSLVGSVPAATSGQVGQALADARAAQPGWAATDPAERGRLLRGAAARLARSARELAALNSRETGRPQAEALAGVGAGIATLEQYAEPGPLHRGVSLRGAALASDYTLRQPRGVAALLTPWNDPVAVAAGLLGAALVTGNTVLHKPSGRCPHVGLLLGEALAPAFPPGVLATLTGGPEVGRQLAAAAVDVVAHVGSSATGSSIAQAALSTGAHVIRENGGNDPLLADEGVDPAWAAGQAATGAFSNSGQICTPVGRIYVHQAGAGAFCDALAEQARRWNREGRLGPLVDRRMRVAVHTQVSRARDLGAVAAEGGTVPDGPGAYYPATVLLDCTEQMEIMTEETFGPVAP